VACALAAAGGVAVTTLLTRRVADRTDGHDGLALSIAVAALLTLPVGLPVAIGGPGLGDLGVVAAVGVLGIALPYALEFDALRRVGVKTYSILLSLDPAVAGLAGLFLLGQHLSPPRAVRHRARDGRQRRRGRNSARELDTPAKARGRSCAREGEVAMFENTPATSSLPPSRK
jgi:inner membrane transporter RhtA